MAERTAGRLGADWRERLARVLLERPEHRRERCRQGAPLAHADAALLEQVRAAAHARLEAAAVLVPVVDRPEGPTVLLTARAQHLRRHAGQISFPGGRLESGDADVVAAALRETREEIGLDSALVRPLGFMVDHIVQSGFRITPVVALVDASFELRIDAREVASAFEVPLALALDMGRYQARRRVVRGMELNFWELSVGEHTIWGATAGILLALGELLGLHAGDGS